MHTVLERKMVVYTGAMVGMLRYADLASQPPGLQIPDADRAAVYHISREAGGYLDVHKANTDALMKHVSKVGAMIINGEIPADQVMRIAMGVAA